MSRAILIVTLLAVLSVSLSACGAGQTSGGGGGGTLTRAMTSEPNDLDPQGAANSGLSLTLPYLYDTLIARQADGKLVGLLAESWQASADGKSIEVKLKRNVKFHDGSAFNAAAVVFTFERFKSDAGAKSPIAGDIKSLARVEALDDYTVRFGFDKPTPTFISTLTMPYAGILSPSAVKAAGAEMGQKPVGTGPFKLEEWKRGVSITLVRNPDYKWGTPEATNRGPMKIEKFVYKVIPDANTQLAALQAGEVDVIFVNDPAHVARLQADKSLTVRPVELEALIFLGYNCAKAPFDDVKVRQALSYAVDKSAVVKLALGGQGEEAMTLLPPGSLGYDGDLKQYGQGYDPAKAKALLTEAGFKQGADGAWERAGQKLGGRLLTSNRAPNEAVATVLQSQLKAIGVPVEIQQLDSAAVQKATNEGAFDLLLWRYEWNDPDGLNIYLSTSRIRQTNRVFYSNPQVDALLDQGAREMDTAKRVEIYKEAQKTILTEAPWQPVYTPVDTMAFRQRVQGTKIGSMGRLMLNDVTLSGK